MTPVTSESSAAPDREVLVELLGLHARAMRRMPWVQTWIVVGLGLFIFVQVNRLIFIGWGLLNLAIELGRSRFDAGVLKRDLSADPYRTHRQFVILAAVAGARTAAGGLFPL